MILKKGTIGDFARCVEETNQGVIVYGAGVIGQIAAPYWLLQYRLGNRVICYVDADPHKCGQTVKVDDREILVRSLSALDEESGHYILLVTVSAFEPVVRALEQIPGTRDAEVYFLPIMLLDIAHAPKASGVVKTSETQLIPKKIHYCWFGKKPIPAELQKCMDSWKRFCPDYEIIHWDEDNYDIHKSPYMEQAHAQKKWGFVSDYARLDILYQHGGIYMDTDVELIRNLDELLYQPAFCGVEVWGTVGSGASLGAQAENPVLKVMLDLRNSMPVLMEDGTLNQTASGYCDTLPLLSMGLCLNGETQVIANGMMTVYSADFFLPFDYVSGVTNITKNTFSIHHYSGSWTGERGIAERLRTQSIYEKFIKRLE